MLAQSVHDREELATLLRRDPELHAYELGDLDDFYWPYTTWFRLEGAVALIYHGGGLPTLLAFHRDPQPVVMLLRTIRPLLPAHCYAHISAGAEHALSPDFTAEPHGLYLKLALTDPDRLAAITPEGTELAPADLPELSELYRVAYPDNAFNERMLETRQYQGVRRDGRLVAVAGIHTWSPAHRVAALGNVTTHPDYRGKGLATAAVTALCLRLRSTVDHLTLNVKADNAAAIALYTRLGFTEAARYHELTLTHAV